MSDSRDNKLLSIKLDKETERYESFEKCMKKITDNEAGI